MSKGNLTRPKTLRDLLRGSASRQSGWDHELDAVLRGLDDDLVGIERAITPEVLPASGARAGAHGIEDRALVLQYELLESAIAAQDLRSEAEKPARPAQPQAPSLTLGSWLLEDDAWTLTLSDGSFTLPLNEGERAALVLIARAPYHRVTEMAFLEAMSAHCASPKQSAKLVRHLRSRVRAFGLSLPVLRQRDGSYRFVHRAPFMFRQVADGGSRR